MKKTLVLIAAALTTISAFGQGFISTSALGTGFTTQTNGVPNGTGGTQGPTFSTATAGNAYYFRLLTSTDTGPGQSAQPNGAGWLDTGISLTNRNAGAFSSFSSSNANNWAAGASNAFIIVGWSANLAGPNGLAVALAQYTANAWNTTDGAAAYFGFSVLGWGIASGPSPSPAYKIFGAPNAAGTPINVPMTLVGFPVPEPTTFTLAGLATAALLIFRRRK